MFGKPEWFKLTTCCYGVSPTSLQGWLYLLLWKVVIVAPMAVLGVMGLGFPEPLIWLGFSGAVFLWDVREIRRQLQTAHDRTLYYIGGEEPNGEELATRHFDMKIRG